MSRPWWKLTRGWARSRSRFESLLAVGNNGGSADAEEQAKHLHKSWHRLHEQYVENHSDRRLKTVECLDGASLSALKSQCQANSSKKTQEARKYRNKVVERQVADT